MENNIGEEDNVEKEERPWGNYRLLFGNIDFKERLLSVKILEIQGKARLSVQSHRMRNEYWSVLVGKVCAYRGKTGERMVKSIDDLDASVLNVGDGIIIPKNVIHSLENILDTPAKVLELSFGYYDENDIIRYADIYGRIK